jgi:hypothetical protein
MYGFVAHEDDDTEPYEKRKDFDALWIIEEFRKLKEHLYLCVDARKFKDVESSEQSTLTVLNLTHPDGVRYTALEKGVGTWTSLREGGANTATNKRPTMAPIKIH